MWWAIWGVLVAGTLAGAFFLFRSLWRKGMTLARALGDASTTFGEASARISEAVEAAQANAVDTSPTMFDDPTDLRERVTVLREARAERKAARLARYRVTAQSWSVDEWLTQRKASKSSQTGRT